jgi:hypothetical protein
MAMNPATLLPIMLGILPTGGVLGIGMPQLANGLANGLSIYVQSGITVKSVDTGTAGAGVGSGVGIIVPPAIIASMTASFLANGMAGVMSPPFATAVANGFMQSFALAQIVVASAGVGVGAGVATLNPNPGVSVGAFLAGLTGAGLVGISVTQLASAVALGLDQVLPTSTGIIAIAGSPSIVPAVGIGLGKLF